MASSWPESEPYCLSPLDNHIRVPYVQMALFFPILVPDVSLLVQNMTFALAQTLDVIPALGGTITHLPDDTQRGRLAVTAPWRTPEDVLKMKDLRRTDYPTYESLRSKQFPRGDIEYDIIMPPRRPVQLPRTKPLGMDERPVLLAQINIIKGGMILGFVLDHAFTDGTGSITIARVWAAYCCGEDGSQLLSPRCVDRTPLMKGDQDARIEDIRDYAYYSDSKVAALRVGSLREVSRSGTASVTGEIFFFPKAKLKKLKKMVSKLESDETSWISTHDALASLLWCCVTAAQRTVSPNDFESIKDETASNRPQATENSSLLGFLFDARRFATPPLPARFIGNVVVWGSIIKPLSTVIPTVKGVTECAHSLRRKLRQHDDTHLPRFIGAMKSVPDISKVRQHRSGFDERSLLVNSWAAQDWYNLDWGQVVGRCERVRTEKFNMDNFCLVLPELKGREGNGGEAGLEVIVNMKSHSLEKLRENELFNSFAEWRCN